MLPTRRQDRWLVVWMLLWYVGSWPIYLLGLFGGPKGLRIAHTIVRAVGIVIGRLLERVHVSIQRRAPRYWLLIEIAIYGGIIVVGMVWRSLAMP